MDKTIISKSVQEREFMMFKKHCSKCKRTKGYFAFYKNKSTKDGLSYWCKGCNANHQREYVEKNRKKVGKYSLRYYYSHRKGNPKYMAIYRKANKKYKLKNPEKIIAHNMVNWFRDLLLEDKCADCGKKKDLQLHHPDYCQPMAVVTLCRKCHQQLHKFKQEINQHPDNSAL